MQRSSTDNQYLKVTLFSLFLVLYQIMTSIYTFLPLFIGIFFAYAIINYEDENKRNSIYLTFLYLSFYDLNKGFYLFSSLLLFILFYNFFVDKIRNFFTCSNCIIVIYVFVAYFGHFVLNSFIAYILNAQGPLFSLEYFYFIVIDSIFAVILFKGRV